MCRNNTLIRTVFVAVTLAVGLSGVGSSGIGFGGIGLPGVGLGVSVHAQVASQSLDQDTFSIPVTGKSGALNTGGLQPTLWQGVTSQRVEELMNGLAYAMTSPTAAQIQRAVLAGPALPPEGTMAPPQLQLARMQALFAAGHVDGARELLTIAGAGVEGQAGAAQLDARIRFLRRDPAGACGTVNGASMQTGGGFWVRARATCLALAGEGAAAELTLDLAQRQGVVGADADFAYWIAAASGAPTMTAPPPPRDGLELILAGVAGAQFSPTDVAAMSAPVQVTLASDMGAGGPARLAAAKASVARATLDSAALDQAFDLAASQGPELTSAQLTQLMNAGVATNTAMSDPSAAFVQAAVTGENPDLVLDALGGALQSPQSLNDFMVTARYLRAVVARAPASFMAGGYAPVYAQAALVAGDYDTASKWVNAAYGSADTDRFAYTVLAVMLAVLDPQSSPQIQTQVAQAMFTAATTDAQRQRAARVALIVQAFGPEPVGDARQLAALGQAASPPLPGETQLALARLRAAADAGVPGEVAALAAVLVDKNGPDSTLVVAETVKILWWFGLDGFARDLALEGILALDPRFAAPSAENTGVDPAGQITTADPR